MDKPGLAGCDWPETSGDTGKHGNIDNLVFFIDFTGNTAILRVLMTVFHRFSVFSGVFG